MIIGATYKMCVDMNMGPLPTPAEPGEICENFIPKCESFIKCCKKILDIFAMLALMADIYELVHIVQVLYYLLKRYCL